MANVTINKQRFTIWGDRRVKLFNLNTANTGDVLATSQLTAFRFIEAAQADSNTSTAVNTSFTFGSGGPITFNYSGGGAQANIDVIVVGK